MREVQQPIRRRSLPRLPWKRGPIAWQVAERASEILAAIEESPKRFFSLRKSARLLGVSTQPLRDWIRRGYLYRTGPRSQIGTEELTRCVRWLVANAEEFGPEQYLMRIYRVRPPVFLYAKLGSVTFEWPKGETTLTPNVLSGLIGCHPSLITKALNSRYIRGNRKTPSRWLISKRAWMNAVPWSVITTPPVPKLPAKNLIPTKEAAWHLRECGMLGANQLQVRKLIHEGALEATRITPGQGKLFVTKTSLKKFRQQLLKPLDSPLKG